MAPVNAQQAAGIANINSYQPSFATAQQMAYNAAQPISQQQIEQYMSPYTQDVVKATQAQFNNTNAQQNQQVLGNAAIQGALGGNRVGIAQAELANQQNLAQAPVIAGLENQGYMTGLNTALTEQQAMQSGAYGVAGIGQAGIGAAGAQMGAGSLLQQTQQQQDIANYQQFMLQMGYPFQTTQWLGGLGTGVGSQMGGTTAGTGTTTGPPPNYLAQGIAGLMGGTGLLGATGAFGANGWMTSDRRLKENIKQVGTLNDGQKVYKFNYKGDPTAHIGLIAQEVEKKHPDAVGVAGGYKMVDYDKATEGVANKQSGGGLSTPYSLPGVTGYVPGPGMTPGGGPPPAGTPPMTAGQYAAWINDPTNPLTNPALNPFTKQNMEGASGLAKTFQDLQKADSATPEQDAAQDTAQDLEGGEAAYLPETARRGGAIGVARRARGGNVGVMSLDEMWDEFNKLTKGPPSPPSRTPDGVVGYGTGGMPSGTGTPHWVDDTDTTFADQPADNGVAPVVPAAYHPNNNIPVGNVPTGSKPSDDMVRGGPRMPRGAFSDPGEPPPPEPSPPIGVAPGADQPQTAVATAAPTEPPPPAPSPPVGVAPADVPLPTPRPKQASLETGTSADTGVSGAEGNPLLARARAATKVQETWPDGTRAKNNYENITTTLNKYGKPQRALGAYGIMDFNLKKWSKETFGQEVSPDVFLSNPKIQDAIYDHKMGEYIKRFGVEGAGRAWLGGEGSLNAPLAKDPFGTTVGGYGKHFASLMGGSTGGVDTPTSSHDNQTAVAPKGVAGGEVANQQAATDSNGWLSKGLGKLGDKLASYDWSSNNPLWMSLMSAGAAGLASRSPFLGNALGEALGAGAQAYYGQKMNAQQQELAAKKLSQQLDIHHEDLAEKALTRSMHEKHYANDELYKMAELKLKQQGQKLVDAGFDENGPVKAILAPDGKLYRVDPRNIDPTTGEIKIGDTPIKSEGPNPLLTTPSRTPGAMPGATPTGTSGHITPVADKEPLPEGLRPAEAGRDEAYLDQVKSEHGEGVADTVKAIADYRINPTTYFAGSRAYGPGMATRRETIMRMVEKYTGHTYDQTLFPSKQRAVNEFFAGGNSSPAGVLTAGNTAVLHASDLYKLVDKIKDLPPEQQTWFTKAADWLGETAEGTGVPHATLLAQEAKNWGIQGTPLGEMLNEWNALKDRYAEEVTKFYAGSSGALADRERTLKLLNPALSREELKGGIARELKTLNDKVVQYNNRIMNGMMPQAWREALMKSPELVTRYSEAHNGYDSVMNKETERSAPSAAPRTTTPAPTTTSPVAPAASGVPTGSVPGTKDGKKVWRTPDGKFLPRE